MVLHLAQALEVPLRHRNALLRAAGFAEIYPEASLDDPTLEAVSRSLGAMLERLNPFPAILVDRHWNVRRQNRAASILPQVSPGRSPQALSVPLRV